MSYAIINARRYFVLLNYQYGLKRKKKVAMGLEGFEPWSPGIQGTQLSITPQHRF